MTDLKKGDRVLVTGIPGVTYSQDPGWRPKPLSQRAQSTLGSVRKVENVYAGGILVDGWLLYPEDVRLMLEEED